jgi:kinesin family protein C2/C3
MTALKEKIDAALAERDEALALYTKEMKLRKSIHNKLLEIQGNIRVICRVRPILEVEHKSGQDVDVTDFPTDDDIVIKREGKPPARFEFDRVFAPGTTQLQVFEAVQPVCVSVLDGYNACIFAYGQTGSGKTYTMEGTRGDSEHVGVSPRAISELFNLIESMQSDWTYTLTFSMLEIYNETVRDLLDCSKGEKEKLDIRQSAEGNVVSGLTEMQVTSSAQVIDLMARGQSNRAVGSHDMNEHSSRSHSILTIVCRGRNNVDGTTTFGKWVCYV